MTAMRKDDLSKYSSTMAGSRDVTVLSACFLESFLLDDVYIDVK